MFSRTRRIVVGNTVTTAMQVLFRERKSKGGAHNTSFAAIADKYSSSLSTWYHRTSFQRATGVAHLASHSVVADRCLILTLQLPSDNVTHIHPNHVASIRLPTMILPPCSVHSIDSRNPRAISNRHPRPGTRLPILIHPAKTHPLPQTCWI